nr:retrovirus-related Pol polyprotein from transposon TNT 1-94 [Tanacetum cinerariifolium]
MVAEDDEMSKDKEIDKLMALISLSFKKIYKPTNNNLRTSSNTSQANQDNSPRINRGTRECQKPKRVKDAAYHREKMLLCKQEEAGIQLNAEQADWRDDTDDESDDQELEAHYMMKRCRNFWDTTSPNPICLMAKATSSQAWLWHRHLSHPNFDTINLLSNNDIVTGLLKLKFIKYHLCSSCDLGKAKRKSFQPKATPSSKGQLQLLHMDCVV